MKSVISTLRAVVLAAVLLCVNAVAFAENGEFDTPERAFSWYSKGPGCMHVAWKLCNNSPKRTFHNGDVVLTDVKTGEEIKCFFINEINSGYDGYVEMSIKNYLADESHVFITNVRNKNGQKVYLPAEQTKYQITASGSGTYADTYLEFDWYFPVRFAGRKFQVSVVGDASIWLDGTGYAKYEKKNFATMEFDEINLDTYDAIPGTEDENKGSLRIPVSCDRVMNYADVSIKTAKGWRDIGRTTFDSKAYSGFIKLPSYEAIDSVKTVFNVTSASWTDVTGNAPKSLEGAVTKITGAVQTIHGVRLLKSEMLRDSSDILHTGAVKLQWQIGDVGKDDILEGDMFQVQRSLTGRIEDYKDIALVQFDKDSLNYEYLDTTLISALDTTLIDKALGIPLVRYRVFRAATSALWGMEHNPTMAYTMPQMPTLDLHKVEYIEVEWADEEERKVKATWRYTDENSSDRLRVWDDRAQIKVIYTMYNRDNKEVGTVEHIVTKEEAEKKTAIMQLNRSCVYYEFRIETVPGTSPIGNGTGNIFVQLKTSDDWSAFAKRVNSGELQLNAILFGDISITEPIAYYKGVFNGNGYKLSYNFFVSRGALSPFAFLADGAVICNTTFSGKISSNVQNAAGIASIVDEGVVSIENCTSNIDVHQEINAWYANTSNGGLVGTVNNSASLFISNSLFNGSFTNNYINNSGYGGFVGFNDNSAFTLVSNSYFAPTRIDYKDGFWGTHTFANYYDNDCLLAPAIMDCLYKTEFGTLQGSHSSTAPRNYLWNSDVPAVSHYNFSTPTKDFTKYFQVLQTKYQRFYYENSGKVLKDSLKAETHQTSVTLTWQSDGGAIDSYEIYRRTTDRESKWERIARNITQMEYEDKTVKPVFQYYYKVASLVSCEGEKKVYTDSVIGNCVQHGRIEGYVRFSDGSGIPDVSISVSQQGEGASSQTWHATTDAAGYFRVDSLPYWQGQTGKYLIMPNVSSNDLTAESRGGLSVTFNSESNLYQNRIFTVTTGVRFTGTVLYHHTSIPVQGVSFMVDGKPVRSGSGAVTSDFEGHFSFCMLPGKHTIQAVKDGHEFWQGGYYTDESGETFVEFSTDKASIYFYDDTKVKLIGRIAGGKQQGDIPLGNSLSRNNLGKDLKMVMTLEGDNASWLVFENTDRSITERDTTYIHTKLSKSDNKVYQTKVHTNRHRIEITPDVNTGEYELLLPPVKWKIQQITALGYSTLFQDGKTSDVIDLTDSLTEHTDTYHGAWSVGNGDTIRDVDVKYYAKYNRIYRSPIQIEYKQAGYDKFDYFGDRIYTAQSLVGDKVKVPLVYQENDSVKYTFGYPVFNIDRQYPFVISAVEKYYFNNNTKSDTVDIVSVNGGEVTIRNGMVSGLHKETVTLDENGEAYYVMQAAQRPYLVTGKDALYTVSMTLLKDGVTYEATPLKAYTLNQYSRPGTKDYLSVSVPLLVDVLRDPPGSGSSAKLSKGSTQKTAYQMDMSWAGGLQLGVQAGSGTDYYTGIGGLGFESGFINTAKTVFKTSFDLIFSGSGQRAFSYTMTANEDISTDAGATMVGADADVYMGLVTDVYLRPTVMIRAIPDSTFQHKIGELAAGRMVEIAKGYGDDGGLFHLVRDEAIGYGQRITADFAHTQTYIIEQLIPDLANQALALMYIGTESQAQSLANSTGKPVYLSLRSKDDDRFGILNTDSVTGNYVYNTTRTRNNIDQSKMNYLIVLPSTDNGTTQNDEVYNYAQLILGWTDLIAMNEQQKLEATDLVKHFDVDGGASISYSEDFSTEYNNSHTFKQPFTTWMNNYFEWDDVNNHTSAATTTATVFSGIAALLGKTAAQFIGSIAQGSLGSSDISGTSKNNIGYKDDDDVTHYLNYTNLEFVGLKWKFGLNPVISYDMTPKQTTGTKYNRKESFTIKMDKKSHLQFDVYRVNTIDDNKENPTVTGNLEGDRDIFVETNFLRNVEYVKNFLDRKLGLYDKATFEYPKSFVYRTRGGATVRTWEDERKTLFYNRGTVLDERTKKIENPVIKLDKQSVSGVPYGEPARFKIYMTNESEEPDAIGGVLRFFTLFADSKSNPDGAKMFVDGMPLTADGMTVMAVPGEVTQKSLEVYAGETFDYDNLVIGIISPGDVQCVDQAAFSVHYLRTAGSVSISNPGNKWIMNTDAPFDSLRGWYMPVVISGYDRNQKNFDHIEFQYKETTRGDDYWTNLCSFYADSTYYRQASGTREMMPENGFINTKFYGEGQVMEKAYDLRAVLFCRNGNSYLTNSSPVLTGIKDTRRPRLFGSPEPKDGIIETGENIIFNFSEPIEHNYLREETNFEVMGETNETVLQEEPALLFTADGKGYVETDARRNFAEKSFAIDIMVRPEKTGKPMPIFSHGIDGSRLQLWLTEDWKLKAVVDSMEYVSTEVVDTGKLQHVALMYNITDKTLQLFNDSVIGTFDKVKYRGYGPLVFGATNESDVTERSHYAGRMLEARVWNRTMTEALMRSYGGYQLTGYEMGLVDYYQMNEGEGNYIVDKAQGADAQITNVSWALPRGMSLRLDWSEEKEVKGMHLLTDRMRRSEEQDYTLMFWFKTTERGKGALVSNGSGRSTDVNPQDRFFIGFEGDELLYRSNGMTLNLGKGLADNGWHHYAMTVSRAHKVANFYVDRVLTASVPADTLGGMDSEEFYVGNMVWREAGANVDKLHQANALTGYIDELCLFEQALPPTLIKHYCTKSPSGKEKGLITYISFSKQVRAENNELVFRPYALNQVIEKDYINNIEKASTDSVFAEPLSYVIKHIDNEVSAPVQANLVLKNLNFSFVGKDNQLLVNIDELDSRINKRNLYVTVYDIPDMNGNYMASPYTGVFYVDRNPLRWSTKMVQRNIISDLGTSFSVSIRNESGMSHVYSIENLPNWLTVDHSVNIVDAKEEQEVMFEISGDLNVGTYDETIYLVDENGMSEPLVLNVKKEGMMPGNWYPTDNMKRYSMSLVGRVKIGDAIVTDTNDRLGAFDGMGRCLGVGDITYDEQYGVSLVFLTVFDSTVTNKPLFFKLWHNRTGKVIMLQPDKEVSFVPSQIVGSVKEPVIFYATDQYVQTVCLDYGWNWLSLNVNNDDFRNVMNILNNYKWDNGDIFVSDRDKLTMVYNSRLNAWLTNQTDEQVKTLRLRPQYSYRVYRHNSTEIEVVGDKLEREDLRTVPVSKGWNSIGYTPAINLPVSTALTDYSTWASDRDVVKNRESFAIFTSTKQGSGYWSGDLKYMKPGEGYMLYRHGNTDVEFKYPYYEPGSTFFEKTVTDAKRVSLFMMEDYDEQPTNMSLAAAVTGIETEEGDLLLAMTDIGTVRGVATEIDSVFYMSIAGEAKATITFAIEREGEIIAKSQTQLQYEANAVSGSPSEPTQIEFTRCEPVSADDDWYSTDGRKLGGRPAKAGVYVRGTHKVVIK